MKSGEAVGNRLRREDAVCVELHSLAAYRHGEIQSAAGRQNSFEGRHEFEACGRVDRIGIAPKPKVFRCVEAGDGIDTVIGKSRELGCVVLQKCEAFRLPREGANVHNGDRHKNQEVGYESIDPRSDIDMPVRFSLKDLSCCPQILMEIMSADSSRSLSSIRQDGA